MADKTVLAIDLGAESGRVMAVQFDGTALALEELHRFENPVTEVNGTLHWDFLHLWREITAGIDKGRPLNPLSLGVDTWGVDFGLLDQSGALIGNPVNYRDPRTEGMMEAAFARVSREEIFAQTGIQFMPINTLYQLMSLVVGRSPQLAMAETFLTAPDLLNFWLTGRKACEFSNATTTQLFNPTTGTWAAGLMEKLGIPTKIFPEIVQPGTLLGEYRGIPVIAPACHDTGSAVAAVPAQTSQYAYISSGTWSLVGLEVDQPVITPAALEANVTNEGGVYGTYRLLKNVMGLWIVQQCRATWAAQGDDHSYADLTEMAAAAGPSTSLIDPNSPDLLPPGDHPARIQALCRTAGQPVPQTKGQIIRCVLESLAHEYDRVLDQLARVAGKSINIIHIVGGGTQNRLLNQLTADAAGRPVITGPVEATVLGNALVQFIALGEIPDLQTGRDLIRNMGNIERFDP
ncbi:MAG: rhamnulokinase family protein [Ardenticatenaceae bacterium]|nr:rhamnulokinase family protein [Ardenticatenaceae bacterium]